MTTLEHYAEINPPCGELDRISCDQVAFVPMVAVSEDGRLGIHGTRALTEVAKGYTSFLRGDVLMAKITPCMENGKAALVSNLSTAVGFGSTEFHVLRPRRGVDGRFLFYLVWNQAFREDAAKHMTGTAGQKRVPASYLKQAKVPLVDPHEQRRIADILDKADAIRRKRKETIALTDDLLRSTFLDMFGDPVANPKRWPVKPLGQLLSAIQSGWSPICLGRSVTLDEWGVLKLGAVTSGRYDDSANKALTPFHSPDAALEVREGDVLFARKNTYEHVAACVFVTSTRPRLMLPDLLFRLVLPTAGEMLPMVLWAMLSNTALRRHIQRLATGTAGSMPNISKERLRTVIVPIPAHPLQVRFTEMLRNIERLRRTWCDVVAQSDVLFESLVSRSFHGKVVMMKDYAFRFSEYCRCGPWAGTVHWSLGHGGDAYVRKVRGAAEVFLEGQAVPRVPSGGQIAPTEEAGQWEYVFSCPDCGTVMSVPAVMTPDSQAHLVK